MLEQHPPRGDVITKRAHLQIITLGHSPLVFGVLRNLIHYLLTTPAHPYSVLHPGINALGREQEVESVCRFSLPPDLIAVVSRRWLNRPESCKITICETRPSCSGVVLAERLLSVVEASAERAKELRAMSKPGGPKGLAMGIRDRIKQQKQMHGQEGSEDGGESAGSSLGALVTAVDSPNPSCKVSCPLPSYLAD